MSKPVTPQEMFDLWQKMVNPGAYPLQSLMFPVLDSKELERKIAELEVVEHWLKANVNMVQLTIKSLQFQRDMVKGGEKALKDVEESGEIPNPAMWAWNMMAEAAKAMPQAPEAPDPEKEKKRTRKR
jgi:hypothetical protein